MKLLYRSYAAEYLAEYNPKGVNFVLTVMERNLPQQTLQKYQEKGIQHVHMSKRDERDENLLEVFGELCAAIEEKLQGYVWPWPKVYDPSSSQPFENSEAGRHDRREFYSPGYCPSIIAKH